MRVQSKKNPHLEYELTPEQWEGLKKLELANNFRVVDNGMIVKKQMQFPEEIKTIKQTKKLKK